MLIFPNLQRDIGEETVGVISLRPLTMKFPEPPLEIHLVYF